MKNLNTYLILFLFSGILWNCRNTDSTIYESYLASTDLYIDFDNITTNYFWNQLQGRKTFIGDVDVFDANSCFCIYKKP